MTIKDLASLWDEGENSFSKDPPNGGMYMAKKHGIVVLKSLVIENSNAVFTFTMDDNSQDTFVSGDAGMLVLVIDSMAPPIITGKSHHTTGTDGSSSGSN